MEWQLSRQWVSRLGSCAQWADHFIATLDSKCREYDELHLVFDRYDLPTSLKEATRERRQGRKPATAYLVTDNTQTGKVSAKQFLSSTATKDELTVYLAKKALHHFEGKPKVFIVTSRQEILSNSMDVQHLCSSQEEADTRLILHSLDAVRRGATELYIQSPDTDVFCHCNPPLPSALQEHILCHWCGEQEASNLTWTNRECTW